VPRPERDLLGSNTAVGLSSHPRGDTHNYILATHNNYYVVNHVFICIPLKDGPLSHASWGSENN